MRIAEPAASPVRGSSSSEAFDHLFDALCVQTSRRVVGTDYQEEDTP
jgi:hypothetical protein